MTFKNRVLNIRVEHPKMLEIYKIMDSLIKRPGKTRHLFIIGSSNVGKTIMAENYVEKYPKSLYKDEEGTEVDIMPVLYVEVPHPFTLMEFYYAIIDSLGAIRLESNPKVNDLKIRVHHLLKVQKVKLIIFDEINNILTSRINNSEAMDAIKHLSNKTGISLVLMGTPESKTLRALDEQYKSRYRPKTLTRFESCDDEFCDFLKRVEEQIKPPSPIGLGEKSTYFPQLLFEQSKGKIGYLIPIIQEAFGLMGIFEDSKEKIDHINFTPDLLNEAYEIIQGDMFDDAFEKAISFK
ncbi:hypothetical protein B4U37_19630 [Sutcliffiella horikoshii]|uniref:TniB protein n=1 Tax=Sutcliffiella horikoshii TaxID=79883 RepID=A0ABN4ZI62_9BACI|nr:TniB family NTP-binding protein [Sutcliffiella horikoshii]ART78112.1 hypothetical protein B4U37_19630 [Sutcliffiella horikoshii]